MSKKRTKPKLFENFEKNLNVKFLKFLWFCALFRQFPAFFDLSKNWKIFNFFSKISSRDACQSRMPHPVSVGLVLHLNQLLPSSSAAFVSAGPRLPPVLSSAPGLLRDGTSEPCLTEIGPCRARVRQRQDVAITETGMHLLMRSLKKISNFSKTQKCWKLSEKRTKPKNFENLEKNYEVEFFQISLVLCAFQTISSIF
jgi:hypothetical protein